MGSCTSAPPDPAENPDSDEEEITNNQIGLSADRYLTKHIPNWFPSSNAHLDISSQFVIKEKIGDGVTGSVFSIIYKKTNKICAVKRIPRSDEYSRMRFITEARCLSKLCHPSIIKYIDMLIDDKYYYLILEKCDYDLWKLMNNKKYLSEHETKCIIHSLLNGIAHIHNKNLCHRDIKPENIVFKNENKNAAILVDFGDAEMATKDKIYTEFVGTPPFMSPERLGKHNAIELKKSDIWAIGVVTYEMYSGQRCFDGNTQKKVFSKILKGEWQWKLERMPSNEMTDFVQQCLHLNVNQRLSANDALKHTWFADITNENTNENTNDITNENTNENTNVVCRTAVGKGLTNENTNENTNELTNVVCRTAMSNCNNENNNEQATVMEEICEYYGSSKTMSPPIDDYDTIGHDEFDSISNIQSVQNIIRGEVYVK